MTKEQKLPELIHEIKVFLKRSYWLTPLNLETERLNFLRAANYNPQFEYPSIPKESLAEYLNRLDQSVPVEGKSLEAYVTNRSKQELTLKIRLLLARGTEELSQISQDLYKCSFPLTYLDQARKDSQIQESFGNRDTASIDEVIRAFQNHLKGYGIGNWTIKSTRETDFYVRVIPSKRLVQISHNINWDFCDLDNTIAHEIDGHVLRAINTSRQKDSLPRRPFPFYIRTEEGLASYLADFHSSTGSVSRKHHALKYLAGYLGLTSSFKEIFDFLVDQGFTRELAFQRTFRLKRGFEDTSMAGIYAREAMYYEGMLQVKEYIDNNGDLSKLFACKCGLEDLQYSVRSDDQILPKRLAENYRAKN